MAKVKRTESVIKINSSYLEAGELAREIGKYYWQELNKSIEDHRSYKKPILYFFVKTVKNPHNVQHVHIKIGVFSHSFNKMYQSTDYWKYDYNKEELSILWSLPHRIGMKNYLREPEKYDKKLIRWIKAYLKQEGLDLNKINTQVII